MRGSYREMRPRPAIFFAGFFIAAVLVVVILAVAKRDDSVNADAATPTTLASTTTTTVAPTPAEAAANEAIWEQANAVLTNPTTATVAELAIAMGE